MSTALRLDDLLVHEAETEGRQARRSAPKQIEYWAEIGRALSHTLTPAELLAITHGLARVRVERVETAPVDPAGLFAEVSRESAGGRLGARVSGAPFWYEASRSRPGLLDRVGPDGSRESGRFEEGRFVPATDRG